MIMWIGFTRGVWHSLAAAEAPALGRVAPFFSAVLRRPAWVLRVLFSLLSFALFVAVFRLPSVFCLSVYVCRCLRLCHCLCFSLGHLNNNNPPRGPLGAPLGAPESVHKYHWEPHGNPWIPLETLGSQEDIRNSPHGTTFGLPGSPETSANHPLGTLWTPWNSRMYVQNTP